MSNLVQIANDEYKFKDGVGKVKLGDFVVGIGQPYTTKYCMPCLGYVHRYRCDVVVIVSAEHLDSYECNYTGSVRDHEKDIQPNAFDVAACILSEIMSAYNDPLEFIQVALMGDPPSVTTEEIGVIYQLLLFSERYGPLLESQMPDNIEWWDEEQFAAYLMEVNA